MCLYFFFPFLVAFIEAENMLEGLRELACPLPTVGVNVVCIDAVYKCCIKTSLIQGHKHLP